MKCKYCNKMIKKWEIPAWFGCDPYHSRCLKRIKYRSREKFKSEAQKKAK